MFIDSFFGRSTNLPVGPSVLSINHCGLAFCASPALSREKAKTGRWFYFLWKIMEFRCCKKYITCSSWIVIGDVCFFCLCMFSFNKHCWICIFSEVCKYFFQDYCFWELFMTSFIMMMKIFSYYLFSPLSNFVY